MKEIVLRDNPDVSIILPAQDNLGMLISTLDSIHKQNYKNFELIVIANENARQVLEKFSFDRRFKFVYGNIKSRGVALNIGHGLSIGQFITHTSPGVMYFPMFLEIMRAGLLQRQVRDDAAELVYADFQFLDQNGRATQNIIHSRGDHKETLKNGYDVGVALMYTRGLWEKTGEYWERPVENYQWAVRAAQYTDFGLVNAVLAGVVPYEAPHNDTTAVDDCKELAKNLFEVVEN